MKNPAASLFVFVLSALMLVSFNACQSTKSATSSRLLKFNLEKGKGYDYEMIMNMDQEVMGQQMKMDMTSYYSMNVDEDNGSEKTISTTFERIKMSMDMGPMKVDIDTDNPVKANGNDTSVTGAIAKVNRLFSAIRGKKFIMKVNAEGKVTEVTGLREMGESIISSFGDEMSEEEKQKMRAEFGKQFSDEGMKSQFERVLYIFPNKEVKVGDSWQRSSAGFGELPAKYNSTYTVTEIEGDMVTLQEKSKIESNDSKMDLGGDVDGTLVIDSKSGLLVSCTQNINMKVSAGGMSIDMKGITKVKGKAN